MAVVSMVMAVTVTPEVQVALIVNFTAIVSLFITYILRDRKTRATALASADVAKSAADDVNQRIGIPNGKGNVVQMLETILPAVQDIQKRLTSHDDRLASIEQRMIPPAVKYVPGSMPANPPFHNIPYS